MRFGVRAVGLGGAKQKKRSGNSVLIRRDTSMDDDNTRLLIRYESWKRRLGFAYFLLVIGGGLGLHRFYLQDKKVGGLLCLWS